MSYMDDEIRKELHELVDSIMDNYNAGKYNDGIPKAQELEEIGHDMAVSMRELKKMGAGKPVRLKDTGERVGDKRVFRFEEQEK